MRTIAPFLRLDHDPYVVVSEGRLFWMQDAYTTSHWFPYAQPLPDRGTQLHPQFGQGRHRRLQRDRRLLRGGSVGPGRRDLSAHIPRPVQAVRGHAAGSAKACPLPGGPLPHPGPDATAPTTWTLPEVFYNREDLWQFPRQPTGADARHAGWPLLHHHALAWGRARRVLPHAPHGAEPAART